MSITIDIARARDVGHGLRRAKRQAELVPLDDQIIYAITDATKVATLEAQRQLIRDKYATMQTAIDAAADLAGIQAALAV